MVDQTLLLRLDAFVALATLALVVACCGLMLIDVAVGVLALATVVLVGAVGIRSHVREGRRAATA